MSDSIKLHPSAEKLFEETLQKVKDQLDIKRKDPATGLKLLSRFSELANYRSLYVHKVTEFKGETGSFIVLLIERHLEIVIRNRTGSFVKDIEEVEPVLIFSVPHNMGKVFIHPETVTDKITDLITKVDIDFPAYPDFSKNYRVVGENPDLVRQYFPAKLIEAIGKVKHLTSEISGNWGMLRTEKNLTEQTLLRLLSIGYKMSK